MSLYFIKNKILPYEIKGHEYTTIYRLNKEELYEILKDSPYNYQYLKMLRDKDNFNQT